jgi:hypothetical protein
MTAPARTIHLALPSSEVTITFEGAVASQRVLLGKTPDEAVRLVGLVHNLCAQAHRAACLAATGQTIPDDAARAVMLEILREHLVILCRAAPPLLGLAPVSLPLPFSRLGAAFAPGGAPLRETLSCALFGAAPGAIFSPHSIVSSTFFGPLFAALAAREKTAGLEANDIVVAEDPTFFARIAQDPAFALPLNAGPLSARLMGRLFEIHRLLGAFGTAQEANYAPRILHAGMAQVAAARGTLTHSTTIVGGLIADYSIETPTALMLGDAAPLARFLAGIARLKGADEALIRLALIAFDPCVPYLLETRQGARRRLADA